MTDVKCAGPFGVLGVDKREAPIVGGCNVMGTDVAVRVEEVVCCGVGETPSISTDCDGIKVGPDSVSICVAVCVALTFATVSGGAGMSEYPVEGATEGEVDVASVVSAPYPGMPSTC